MRAVESDALSCLYPKEITKPQPTAGIDPCHRRDAQQELLRYYTEKPDVIGLPFYGDKFKDIAQFLENIAIDPNIGEIELRQLFSPSVPTEKDEAFLHRVSVINNFIERNAIHLCSCSYRPVSAVTQNTVTFEDRSFTLGGVGTSGAHELFRMGEKDEIKILQEAIIEVLIVSGMNVEHMTPDKKASLATMIQEEASRQIQKKQPEKMTDAEWQQRNAEILAWIESGNWTEAKPSLIPKAININLHGVATQLFSNSENCDDYSNHAIRCAKQIIDTLGLQLTIDAHYRYCAMHKYRKYDKYYSKAGLPPPGQFGRLRCPSHCAETQADERNAFSLLLPFTTGDQISYLLDINQYEERRKVHDDLRPERWDNCLTNFHYLSLSKENPEVITEKHLIIENSLSMVEFKKDKRYRSFLYIAEALANKNLDYYRSIRIQFEYDQYTMLFSPRPKNIIVEGVPLYAKNQNAFRTIAEVSLDYIRRIPMSSIHVKKSEKLWTSASPCLHCLNVLKHSNVDTMYIDTIPWEGLKGDDGLALEALSKLPIRTVVLHE